MASPQVENGHLKIANEVWEHLMQSRVTCSELQLCMAVIRKTWGWKTKEAEISLHDFAIMTSNSESTVARGLSKLVSINMLVRTRGGGRGIQSKWSFNKDWETWKTLSTVRENINSLKINTVLNESQSLPTVGEINLKDERVSHSNSLKSQEQLPAKTTSKEKKANRASNEAPSDPRLTPLKSFISEKFKAVRGCGMISDSSDWSKLSALLKSSREDPAYCLEKLQTAWMAFLESEDQFHQKQGHPLRYWASNVNAFIGNGARHGTHQLSLTGSEEPGSTLEKRNSRGERLYVPKQM